MTSAKALREAAQRLAAAGVPDSRLDAEYLLAHALHTDRMALLMHGSLELPPDRQAAYEALLARREAREPLQYILKNQDFMGLLLYVDESVLIPRPETELLCERALAWLRARRDLSAPRALDLCTGSGAIAVAIATSLPGARVSACDLSSAALAVARRNADAHGVRVDMYQGDFLAAVTGQRFDLMVCNPPYIPSAACETLQEEVLREPRLALDGGEDGLAFYRRLAKEAPLFLSPGGALFCEVGHDQAVAVRELFAPVFSKTDVFPDLSGVVRIVSAAGPGTFPGGTHVR